MVDYVMVGDNTRREFLRRYGTAAGVLWGSPATATAGRTADREQLDADVRARAIGGSEIDVTFGCYYVDVDGPDYVRVVLHFSDGHSETFTGEYEGTTTFSYTGYRGNGDVIQRENGIDFGAIPSSPPADETYDQFHGPITRVTVTGESGEETFERAESPGCVTGVDFGCSQVGFDSRWEILSFEMVLLYEDGSYKRFMEYPDIDDDPFGNEFRNNQLLDRVYIQHDPDPEDWYVFENPNTDCTPPGSSTTTFSCTEVTVETELFPTFDLVTSTLEFTDGTSQEVGAEIDDDTEFPITFSGRGEHDGKIISALRIYIGGYDGIVWYLTNPRAAECEEDARTFEVLSTDEDVEFAYEFTVDGDVWKSAANDNRADPDDQVTENDDGTVTVTGSTGDGQGDVFAVVGEITEFEKTGGESGVRLVLDGEDVTDEFLDGADGSLLEIVSLEEGEFSYEVVIDGTAEKARVSEKIQSQDNDEIIETDGETVIDGFTGNPGYGDAYRITGEITEFERTGGDADVVVRLDGEDVTGEYLDGAGGSLLEIVSLEEGEFSYEVVVDGSVEKAHVSEKIQSQDNDEIREADGETVIDGFTGNPGYGDAYRISGDIVEFERTGGDAAVVVRLDGEDVTDRFLDGTDWSLLEIVALEEGEYSYRFEVDGSVEKARVSEKIESEDNDEIRTTDSDIVVVDGFTGNPGYGDAYRISGEVTEFEHTGGDADVVVRLNGSEIPVDELT